MSEINELSFCELKRKDIVSISDGRKLGRIVDLVFSASSGKVQGIVAPYGKKFLFFRSQEVYIPYCNIKTIGEDIILVDISMGLSGGKGRSFGAQSVSSPPSGKQDDPPKQCDGRCDKCMLFDCEDRWRKRNTVFVDNTPYN